MATTSPEASCGAMAVDDRVGVGEQLGGRACGVEGADDIFRMQALGFGDALLLVDAGEDDAVGEAEAGDEIGRENFAAQRVGARLEHGPEARLRIDGRGVRGGFRGWRWDGARSLR